MTEQVGRRGRSVNEIAVELGCDLAPSSFSPKRPDEPMVQADEPVTTRGVGHTGKISF